jgi:hypothetical protein
MKKICVTIALAMSVGALIAWAQSGSSISFSTTGTCAPVAPNITSICGTPTSVLLSLNGAPYVSLQGTPGPKGDPGNPGTAATIAVGTVTTLAAGAPATVTNSGTSSAAVFNIGIPQGAKGDKGDPGTGVSWKTCPFTITKFAQDGNGNASGTLTIDPTKCL